MKLRALALTPFGRANLARSDAVQRLLAFAALIVIIIVFSLLSPNFLQFDNLVGILLATTVTGVEWSVPNAMSSPARRLIDCC